MENKEIYYKCEDEPIHIPQMIQPIGYLFVVNPDNMLIDTVSSNVLELTLNYKPIDFIGKSIIEIIPDIAKYTDHTIILSSNQTRVMAFNIDLVGLNYRFCDAFISLNDENRMIIELVPVKDFLDDVTLIQNNFNAIVCDLLKVNELTLLYSAITKNIKDITMYDRVMLYKFDDDFNGQVIAESKDNYLNSYLNLHFPASDIPIQARELYLKNTIRCIENVDYIPSKLISGRTNDNLDMTYSFLRSVSPLHLEYMRNMNVKASLTVSIIINGKLWGLISCHSSKTYLPSINIVYSCEKLSKIISPLIDLIETKDKEARKNLFFGRLETVSIMLKQSLEATFIDNIFIEHLELIKSLFDCNGFIYSNDSSLYSLGLDSLRQYQVKYLVDMLNSLKLDDIFITDCLTNYLPSLEKNILKTCAGIVVVKMYGISNSIMIWTRTERIQTINWGGEPIKQDLNGYLSPRLSFERFSQTIENHSHKWSSTTKEKAFSLSERIHEILELHNRHEQISKQKQIIKNLEEEKSKNFSQLIDMLVALIEERDAYTAGHTLRVARYSVQLARHMKIDEYQINLLEQAAKLHDIGKVIIPDSVLLKPGKLSQNEYSLIQLHLSVGYDILSRIDYYKPIAEIMKYHHEKYDGSGYPYKIKGDEIPLISSIMAVADSLDAMTSNRIYQKRKTLEFAVYEIQSLSGIAYHPDVAHALLELYNNNQIDVEFSIQLPLSKMEHERFSYFFKDNMTGFFNEPYLWMILNNQIPNLSPENFALIELHGMSHYNQLHGWHTGNVLINNVAKIISKVYEPYLIFRVYGDDFAICFPNDISFESQLQKWNEIKIGNVYSSIRKIDKIDFIQEMQLLW